MTPHAYVLGGVTIKLLAPSVMEALGHLIEEPPSGQIPTVYRTEYNGNTYYSQQYKRVKQLHSRLQKQGQLPLWNSGL